MQQLLCLKISAPASPAAPCKHHTHARTERMACGVQHIFQHPWRSAAGEVRGASGDVTSSQHPFARCHQANWRVAAA